MWEISTPAEIRLREPIEISRRLHTDSITYFLQHLLQGSNRRKRKPSRRDVSPRLIRSPQLPLPIRQPGNESDMVVNLFRRGETARLRAESKRNRTRANDGPSRRDVSPRLIKMPQLPLPIRHPGNESDKVVNLFRRGETARLRAESKRYRAQAYDGPVDATSRRV